MQELLCYELLKLLRRKDDERIHYNGSSCVSFIKRADLFRGLIIVLYS